MIEQMFGNPSSELSQYDSIDNDISSFVSNSNSNSNIDNLGVINGSCAKMSPTLENYVAVCVAFPRLRDVPSSERQIIFIRKLGLCSVVFDFTDRTDDLMEKDAKRRMLLELIDYIASVDSKFPEVVMQEIAKMVSANLFRALPSFDHGTKLLGDVYSAEDDDPIMEPAWPHLQIVYEFLLRFVSSSETDAKLAKRYIDHTFVLRLLDLFDTEDQREREYLKMILHRIYGKFMVHRPFIREVISNIFYRFIFETQKHNGIAELLEILGSIINGFTLPLKEEHKLFLARALIPLHKPKLMSVYHQQLTYCIIQFVEKDFELADTVINGLLKYWPVTNSSKELMFLNELEEVLEATQAAEFQRCMIPLFRQIGCCVNSSHFQVAERALFLLSNDHIRNLIILNQNAILPIIFAALERNARSHWNQGIQSLTSNIQKIFSDADPTLYNECADKFQNDEIKEQEMVERRALIWKQLEDLALSNAVSIFPSPVSQSSPLL